MDDISGEYPCGDDCEMSGHNSMETSTTVLSGDPLQPLQSTSATLISDKSSKYSLKTLTSDQGYEVHVQLQTRRDGLEERSSTFLHKVSLSPRYLVHSPSATARSFALSSATDTNTKVMDDVDIDDADGEFVSIGGQTFSSLPMNIALIVSISIAVSILFCMLAYILYKCHMTNARRDEAKVYTENSNSTPPTQNGKVQAANNVQPKAKKKDIKEWYV